ncbi:MAG: 4Fe-4S binding protein [Chloroflexi bacterium]|nr:4Fe-4S binding protein [Anaerolineaceae bacterium]NMD27878.1 4Fe-4S binding protein [Chloroflexota bacterium]
MTNDFVLPILDLSLCSSCGQCASACPEHALEMNADSQHPTFVEPLLCTYCTECEIVCPENAIHCPVTITWIIEE